MADERCGLSAAVEKGERDLRYPLGPQQPLGSLIQEFKYSQNHSRKIGELLQRGFTHFRRVRGDGNCFYRAVGFGWLEGLAISAAARNGKNVPLGSLLSFEWPPAASFGELAREYSELRRAVEFLTQGTNEKRAREIGRNLLLNLLGDVRFDLCVVVFVRMLIASFMEKNSIGGDDSVDAIMTTVIVEYGSIQNFVDMEVLPLGKEAEGAAIVVAARQLGVLMRIIQLDGTSFQGSDNIFPSEDYESPLGIRMCLLYRPGHYELLYHKDLPQLQDLATFTSRCSLCRAPGSLPNDGLLACFHRVCQSCSIDGGGASRCAVCDRAPSANWGLAASHPDAYLLQPKNLEVSRRQVQNGLQPSPQSTATGQAHGYDDISCQDFHRGQTLPAALGPPKTSKLSMLPGSNRTTPNCPKNTDTSCFGEAAVNACHPSLKGGRHSMLPNTARPSTTDMTRGGERTQQQNGVRRSMLPNTARPSTSDMTRGGDRSPQQLDITFSSTSKEFLDQSSTSHMGGQEEISQVQSRCQVCNSRDSLKRVRCCSAHYCVHCLNQRMLSACEQGTGLACIFCRSPWDVQKLALACNIQLPIGPHSSQSSYHRRQGLGMASTMQPAVPRVPATVANLGSATLPSSHGRLGYR